MTRNGTTTNHSDGYGVYVIELNKEANRYEGGLA